MLSWTRAAKIAAKLERMRSVESELMNIAESFSSRNGDFATSFFDTHISRHVVPLANHGFDVYNHDQKYVMHSIRVQSLSSSILGNSTPLVMLHGYMNGAIYFYKNMYGLADYFDSVYSVDMLGWGLSSRPNFNLLNERVDTAEDFFVESLEAWREANAIERMYLAGHSIGGYLSVAYCERYPERVQQLLLISPAGVPKEPTETSEQKSASVRSALKHILYTKLYDTHTLGDILRLLPKTGGRYKVHEYVQRRFATLSKEEQLLIAEYLYLNNTLPGSGEYCLQYLLKPSVFAHNPLQHRIPNLHVPKVTFLYGTDDWMDCAGGLIVQRLCEQQSGPNIEVFDIAQAGHMVMLENSMEFNAGILSATGGAHCLLPNIARPRQLCPYQTPRRETPLPKLIQTMRQQYSTNLSVMV